jgi:hypothetical protein
MAIIDSLLEFSDAQDISQVAATYLSTNQIDMSVAREVSMGQPLYLVIQIEEAVVGSSSTIEFRLRSDSTAAVHATTSTAHFTTGAIAEAVLVAGYTITIPLPTNGAGAVYEQFLGVQYIVGTATTTAGTVNAYLTIDPPTSNKHYADATN